MEELNYSELKNEVEERLKGEETVVLSTSADNRVTARLLCHINYGVEVLVSTNRNSLKVDQMRRNPNVALTVGNLTIEAVAELYGHPESHPTFLADYAAKFPDLGKLYQSTPDDLLVMIRPSRISLYRYIDGPCEDVLLPREGGAYRAQLN